MNDPVNHPPHYTDGKIEVIDFIEDNLTPEEFKGFCKGNVLKYLARADKKGTQMHDYKKGSWYLNRLIKNLESQ